MKSLLTFSQSDLLRECTYPFADDVTWDKSAPTSEEAAWGLAWHELAALPIHKVRKQGLHEVVAKSRQISDPKELLESVAAGKAALSLWLDDNDFSVQSGATYRERSVAYHPVRDAARIIAPPTEGDHIYVDRKPGEFCGTIDLGVYAKAPKKRSKLLVLDYKTGARSELPEPWAAGQLLSGLLALRALHRGSPGPHTAAFLHAPRGSLPTVYAAEVPSEKLDEHRSMLIARMYRVNDGSMRPGAHCEGLYCPKRDSCPTRDAKLLDRALKLLPAAAGELAKEVENGLVANDTSDGAISYAERLGAMHQAAETYDKLRERLRELMREQLRELGHAVRPDGDLVKLIKFQKRRLSLGSIERGVGKMQAIREIKRLEKLGCIEVSEEEQMRKVRDL